MTTVEAPPAEQPSPPERYPHRPAHAATAKRLKRGPTRRGLLIGTGLIAGAIGLGLGDEIRSRFFSGSKPDQGGQPLSQDFHIESLSLSGYTHDLMLPPHPRVAATDNGVSLEIQPGVQLVMLSDTLQGKLTGPQNRQRIVTDTDHWVNNVAVLVDDNKQRVSFITGPRDQDGKDQSWIRPPFDEEESRIGGEDKVSTYYWPQSGVIENGTTVVSLARNKPHLQDMWWDEIGTDIAFFRNGISKEPEIISLPRNDSSTEYTTWGTTLIQDEKKEWTYIAGSTRQLHNNPYNAKEMRMARAPYGQIDKLQQWQFWNGNAWEQVDPEAYGEKEVHNAWKDAEKKAKAVIDQYQGLSQGYSIHNVDNKFVLTTKNSDFLGETIDIHVADSLTGPYTKHTIIDKEQLQELIPASHRPSNGKSWTYLALLHPQIPDPENKGRILLTFCISPDVDYPSEAMRENVNTYSRIPVWIPKEGLLNPDTRDL